MKLLLVIDVADDVVKNYKALTVNYDLRGDYGEWDESIKYVEDAKPRPLSSFKAVDLNDTRDVVMFCHGWNTCLAEITGETE